MYVLYVCMYVCTHVRVCVCIDMYGHVILRPTSLQESRFHPKACIYVCMCIDMYDRAVFDTQTRARAHTHTHTHTYVHTYIPTCQFHVRCV